MEPEYYNYENEYADRFHDYEEDTVQDDEDDYYYDDNLEEGEYDTREDLGWNDQLED